VVMKEHVSGRRWRSMGRRPRQPKEVTGSVLRRFLVADGGSEAHKSGEVWLALRCLEQMSVAMREQRSMARAEWSGLRSAAVARREEMASPMYRQRDEVTHGAAAACVACGADVAAGRQCRCEVAVAAVQLSRAHDASVRAPFKQRRLTSGPRQFFSY
jgi:hypothetical protein